MTWRRVRIGLMVALLAFYVVSCTERPRPGTVVKPGQGSLVTRVEPSAQKVRTDTEQILVCPGDTEPATLEPSLVISTIYEICQHIFDKLVTTDNSGKTIPDLAVEWDRIDPLTMQFKLRKGVKFHNGEPFNAVAVKFSIERLRASENWVFLKSIARVDILDDYRVNIVSSAPDGLLLQRLSFLPFILPPKYYEKSSFGRHPIGTGPYRFRHWEPGGQIVLEKNPQYWKQGVPKLDRLIFKFIPNQGDHDRTPLDQLLAGQLDLLKQSPGTKTLDVQRSAQTTVIKMESTRYVIMLLNPRRPPFSDLRMRQAVAHAIDKDLLINLAVKGNGRKIPFLSSEMDFGHNTDLKPYPFDLSKARALVRESGYSNGSNVVGLLRNESETLARVIAHFLKDIGIDMTYKTVSPQELASARDGFDICIYPYHNPLMHATFQLNQFFEDPMIKSSLSYPQGFDALYEKMIATLDPAAQAQLSYRLEKMAYDQYIIIPLFQKIETYGAAKDLVYSPSISGMLNLSEAYFK